MVKSQYCDKNWLHQKYIKEKLSIHKIAKICMKNPSLIFYWMKKFEIKRRTKNEAQSGKKNHMYGKSHTEDSKKKISDAMKGMFKGENNPFWGKQHTEETKLKMNLKRKGIKLSKETRMKMSQSRKGRTRPPFSKKWIENMSGANSPHWKGGISRERDIIKSKQEYKEWRKAVFKRDNYTCQRCLEQGGKLNAHHILSFSNFPEERFELSNGATSCKACHDWIHSNEISV